jgi:molybdenum cofactor biosynthesis protein MoaC
VSAIYLPRALVQKQPTLRTACASGKVYMNKEAFSLVLQNQVQKGDVLRTAELAGIMGAKMTSTLIPLCHNINITKVDLHATLDEASCCVQIRSVVRTVGITGVEMEALTAASIAALTVYDMCKAVDKRMVISDIQLEHKSGGKSGDYDR